MGHAAGCTQEEGGQNTETMAVLTQLTDFMQQLDEIDEAEVQVKKTVSQPERPQPPPSSAGGKRTRSGPAGEGGGGADGGGGAHEPKVPNPPKRHKPTAPFNVLGVRSARTARIIRDNKHLLSATGSDVASEPSDPGDLSEQNSEGEFQPPRRAHSGRPHHLGRQVSRSNSNNLVSASEAAGAGRPVRPRRPGSARGRPARQQAPPRSPQPHQLPRLTVSQPTSGQGPSPLRPGTGVLSEVRRAAQRAAAM